MDINTSSVAAKHSVISARILALVATGMTALDASRAVLGAENVDAMIDALYSELRGEAVRS